MTITNVVGLQWRSPAPRQPDNTVTLQWLQKVVIQKRPRTITADGPEGDGVGWSRQELSDVSDRAAIQDLKDKLSRK
jgi:hypothetical protein